MKNWIYFLITGGSLRPCMMWVIRNILLIIRSIVWGNNGEISYGKRPSSNAILFLPLAKIAKLAVTANRKDLNRPQGIHFEHLWPRNPERRFTNTGSNTFIRLSSSDRLCSSTKTSQLSSTPGELYVPIGLTKVQEGLRKKEDIHAAKQTFEITCARIHERIKAASSLLSVRRPGNRTKHLSEPFSLNEVKIAATRTSTWRLAANLDKIFVKATWILNRNEKHNSASSALIKYYISFGLERKLSEASHVKARKQLQSRTDGLCVWWS